MANMKEFKGSILLKQEIADEWEKNHDLSEVYDILYSEEVEK